MDIFECTVAELSNKLEKGEITSYELTKAYLDRIKEKDSSIKAYVTTLEEKALAKAKEVDEARKSGKRLSKYAGIPIAIKDNMCIDGVKTTCSSKMLENFVAPYNATVINKLNEQDLVYLGKTNLDEFAMGTTTENSAFFETHNPWDLSKVPGGSSGGSAASVAGGLAPWSLGSDTGGSIRQPASLCGVVGLKPTYGRVSRFGLVAFASSLDQIGPITKTVEDSAILLNMISGYDEYDSTSEEREVPDYTKSLVKDVKGLKIGLPREYLGEGINEEVRKSVLDVAEKYKELGATVEDCSFEFADIAIADYYIIACAEASSNLGRFDGIRYGYRTKNFTNLDDIYKNSRSEGFGPEVKRRIILGTYVLSSGYYDAYYKKAQKVRTLMKEAFNKLFEKYDLILMPASPTTAFKMGEKVNDPLQMYMADVCTVPVNIAGLPGISVPSTVDKNGMPISFQLIAKPFDEETLLKAAYTMEQELGFRDKYKPSI